MLSASLTEYRGQVRAWLSENSPAAPKRSVLTPQDEQAVKLRREWQRELADAGYLGVTWPEQYGGAGGLPAQRIIVEQELDAHGLPGGLDFVGLDMVGPTIMACGSPEQCELFLRPLLRAEQMWCQLLSEPGAGSDLASIQTRARQQDDGSWVVDGQKVWTSFARDATWGIMLARTDPDVPRHKGLTMFAVPMDSEGLTIRPLRQITGDAEFNEVFIDGLRLPDSARIGGPGEGWKVAVTMLSFERLAVGSGHLSTPVEELVERVFADPADRRSDPRIRVRLGQVASELLSLHGTSARLMEEIASGRVPGPEAGLVKITSVVSSLAACKLAADVGGPDALLEPLWGNQISALPGVRSAGGTEEILRNQVGERVLGLPPEPRPIELMPGIFLSLTDEQEFLLEAAQGTLARKDTLQAARAALDGAPRMFLWETAVEAGWPGLLSSEDVDGAGLGAYEAMLVLEACGARVADAGLLGHLPAVALLEQADGVDPALRAALASGEKRAALVDPELPAVLDAAGADVLVVVAEGAADLVELEAAEVAEHPAYDATRSVARVTIDPAAGTRLDLTPGQVALGGALQRALLAADSVGAGDGCLKMATEYAIDRHAFGRAIGSYQAIKHKLVEMLRRIENARSLLVEAGRAWDGDRSEFGLLANAARVVAADALDYCAPENIFIHGGVGATWEHDAQLYYRRAELSRRLAGGAEAAADTVAGELLARHTV